MKKVLIAYYSRRGENYVNGSIKNLPVGNTETVASKIRELTEGELFHIDTVKQYPEDYMECTRVAQSELDANARPELSATVDGMEKYDTIYLGYPNWWGTMPMAVHNFLESYDFTDKTIVPFCTHEGSGMGHSVSDIKALCPKANVLNGIAIRGSKAGNCDDEIKKLINASAL